MTRRWAFVTAALSAGFSGLAVILTILSGVPLAVFEVVLAFVPLAVATAIVRRAPTPIAREVWRVVRAGIVAGFVATLMYDLSRTVLSYLDPSPYDPFGALRSFGLGMVSSNAPASVAIAAGFAIHFVNGASFGVIYAVFGGRHASTLRSALVGGVAWGLTLEFIQSILYPGWLQITTVLNEFLLISGLGHFVYGMSLGWGTRWLLFQRIEVEGQRG